MEVFLSPHPDDAVWSCGGRMAALAAAGRRVVAVTCFSGDPEGGWAWQGERWRTIARPGLRRSEDRRAVALVGAGLVEFGLPEAVWRGGPDGPLYPSPGAMRAGRPSAALIAAVAVRLAAVLTPGDRIHAPLALGAHPDHLAAAAAVRRLSGQYETVWYEDFPYPFRPPPGLTARIEPDCDLPAWLDAAVAYRSQAMALFGGAAGLRDRLRLHAGRCGGQGDRVWCARAAK